MLAFEACTYDFLTLESFEAFLLTELTLLLEGGIANNNGAMDEVRIDNKGFVLGFGFGFEDVDSVVIFLFITPLFLMAN